MDNEYIAVELTDEDVSKVSGGRQEGSPTVVPVTVTIGNPWDALDDTQPGIVEHCTGFPNGRCPKDANEKIYVECPSCVHNY